MPLAIKKQHSVGMSARFCRMPIGAASKTRHSFACENPRVAPGFHQRIVELNTLTEA
jgi:hypothetical protein